MKQKSWIIILLILALCNVVLYFPSQFFFLNDDFIHLALTDEGVFFQHRSIRPIHELLVKFNLLVFGKHAYGFHVTSLILHFVVCIQLFFVSKPSSFSLETTRMTRWFLPELPWRRSPVSSIKPLSSNARYRAVIDE